MQKMKLKVSEADILSKLTEPGAPFLTPAVGLSLQASSRSMNPVVKGPGMSLDSEAPSSLGLNEFYFVSVE